MSWLERGARERDGGRLSGENRGVGGICLSVCIHLRLPFSLMSLAVCRSLSLSLPFWVILVLQTGGFNPAPLLLCLPHPAALCVQFRGSQWAGFPGRGGGCVGEGGGGVDGNCISWF